MRPLLTDQAAHRNTTRERRHALAQVPETIRFSRSPGASSSRSTLLDAGGHADEQAAGRESGAYLPICVASRVQRDAQGLAAPSSAREKREP
ncbi:hypothetical protein WOLCODRAFT_152285 [Wolfiporia cocos MD-104 SS10]|uniref:Uncharacterized protein n=1 Tax=Wolfiporia cocos (strain MD-104) TaxID=742152 RepID=A0A2H3JQT1_WOLCO|nr:hypothetical protein WOLCODRAFT_152285 [Wolfiporia cocos MD-104 SS10]